MKLHTIRLLPLLVATTLGATLPAHAAGGKMKCWTNSEGVQECGNQVPPEYAQKEVRTIDKRGLTTDIKERAKTMQELAEEKKAQAINAKEEEARKERAEHDRMLLSTFVTEKDIIASRDRKLATIDGNIELSKAARLKVQENLDKEKKKAANFERGGKEPPKDIKEEIAKYERQVADKDAAIAAQEKEKADLNAQYDADLQRFRELKGIKTESTPTPATAPATAPAKPAAKK